MSIGITNGSTTIPAGGSQPVQLATPSTAQSVLVYALTTNAGAVYFGGSTVTSSDGVPLLAGSYLTIDIGDVGSIYMAGTQNDVVRWMLAGRMLPA